MYTIKTFNIIDNGQYKSVSNIEVLNSSLNKMDYKYRLNIQTANHLSNTVDIFLDKNELVSSIINPIKAVLKNKHLIINTSIKNIINFTDIAYYKFPRILYSNFLLDILKSNGCKYQFDIRYSIEDDRFLIIESKVTFKAILFNHSPKEIQPAVIRMSLSETNDLLKTLECL